MNALVNQAKEYLGVPFRHRGRTKRGIDCAGLVVRVYADLGVNIPDIESYGREPHKDGLMAGANAALGAPVWIGGLGEVVSRSILAPGDVVIIRFDIHPHHVAFVGDDRVHGLSLVHSYAAPGICRVVTHGLDDDWLKKICAVYRRPV